MRSHLCTDAMWVYKLALHEVGYFAWRVEAERCLGYPDNPLGAAVLAMRRVLQQESWQSWLSEMIVKVRGKRAPNDGR